MSDSNNIKSVSFGFPFITILVVIFAIAKVSGHFAYSWWIVFLPLIISGGIGLIIIGIVIAAAIIAAIVAYKK